MKAIALFLCLLALLPDYREEKLCDPSIVKFSYLDTIYTFEEAIFTDIAMSDFFDDEFRPMMRSWEKYTTWNDHIYVTILSNPSNNENAIQYGYQKYETSIEDYTQRRPDLKTYLVWEDDIPVIVYCAENCRLVRPTGRKVRMRKRHDVSIVALLMVNDACIYYNMRYKPGRLELFEIVDFRLSDDIVLSKTYGTGLYSRPRGLERYRTPPIDSSLPGLGEISELYSPF